MTDQVYYDVECCFSSKPRGKKIFRLLIAYFRDFTRCIRSQIFMTEKDFVQLSKYRSHGTVTGNLKIMCHIIKNNVLRYYLKNSSRCRIHFRKMSTKQRIVNFETVYLWIGDRCVCYFEVSQHKVANIYEWNDLFQDLQTTTRGPIPACKYDKSCPQSWAVHYLYLSRHNFTFSQLASRLARSAVLNLCCWHVRWRREKLHRWNSSLLTRLLEFCDYFCICKCI